MSPEILPPLAELFSEKKQVVVVLDKVSTSGVYWRDGKKLENKATLLYCMFQL